jgi:tRNA threonylcarbamoyladenosine biosynthesis protein TsaE
LEPKLLFSNEVNSVTETKSLGALLAPLLKDGDFISLVGDLGAGKTQFVQGVAAQVGVRDDVISPTFNILLQYNGRDLQINHFDLYRLNDEAELDDIDYFGIVDECAPGVAFVEWADKFLDALPDEYLNITINRVDEQTRQVCVYGVGARGLELGNLWSQAIANSIDK